MKDVDLDPLLILMEDRSDGEVTVRFLNASSIATVAAMATGLLLP